jgi:hypothetical protein
MKEKKKPHRLPISLTTKAKILILPEISGLSENYFYQAISLQPGGLMNW